MKVYIICRYTYLNKEVGFRLLDIEDNNKIIDVSNTMLFDKMKANKILIENAAISINTHKVTGYYHPITFLPCIELNEIQNKTMFKLKAPAPIIPDMENRLVILHEEVYSEDYSEILISNINGMTRNINKNDLYNYTQNIKNYREGTVLHKVISRKKEYKGLLKFNQSLFNKNQLMYKTVQEIQNIIPTDEEAMDKNVIWHMDRFTLYMFYKHWEYDVEDCGKGNYALTHIDQKCKIIHLPVEIIKIKKMQFVNKPSIDTIIIPDTVCNIYHSFNYYIINNVYFQNYSGEIHTSFHMEAFDSTYIKNIAETPSTEILYGAYNDCSLNKLIINDKIKFISKSFNNTNFDSDKKISLYNIKGIEKSFKNTLGINDISIKSPEGIRILDSFDESETLKNLYIKSTNTMIFNSFIFDEVLSDVSLSESNIQIIKDSFNHCKIKHMDFTKFNKLAGLTNSFRDLEEDIIEINPCIKELVEYVGKKDMQVIKILPGLKEIDSYIMHNRKIILPNTVTTVKGRTFINIRHIPDSGLPKSINKLEDEAFRNLAEKEFDTACIPNVTVLPFWCFRSSELNTIIINNNIKEIGEEAFDTCLRLDNVVIGSNVEAIGDKIFNNIKTTITIYLLRDNKIFNKIKTKYKKHVIIEVNSIEEALNIIHNQSSIVDKRKQAKINMILKMKKDEYFEPLLDEKYVQNLEYAYKLINNLLKTDEDISELKLNTDKFMNNTHIDYNISNIRRDFIIKSNIFTEIFDNDTRLLKLLKSDCVGKPIIEYNKKPFKIIAYSVTDSKLGISSKFRIITILINEQIEFICAMKNGYSDTENIEIDKLCTYESDLECIGLPGFPLLTEYRSKSILSELKVGDFIFCSDVKINGINIPNNYIELITDAIRNESILIGNNNEKQLLLKSKIVENLYIELVVNNASHKVHILNNFKIKNISNTIPKEWLVKLSISSSMSKFIDYKIITKEDIQELVNKDNAYDINTDTIISKLGDKLINRNIQTIKDLSTKDIIEILNCELIEKTRLKLSDCIDSKEYTVTNCCKIQNTENTLHELIYKNKKNTYYFGLVISENSKLKKSYIYKSPVSFEKLVQIINNVGSYRKNNTTVGLNGISKNKINTNQFIFIETINIKTYYIEQSILHIPSYLEGICINIAIEKATGEQYIIGEYYDTDFVPLFRCKTYSDVVYIISNKNNNLKLLGELCKTLLFNEKYKNEFIKLWNMIVKGYPNNYAYFDIKGDYYNKILKQPSKETNMF